MFYALTKTRHEALICIQMESIKYNIFKALENQALTQHAV